MLMISNPRISKQPAGLLPVPHLRDHAVACAGFSWEAASAWLAGLRSSELTAPTVTSLGERGTEAVWGVIYPPQVAIIGFGRVVERPWVVDGQVVPRPLLQVSLAADHRVSDGHQGGRLLAAIDRFLQSPKDL